MKKLIATSLLLLLVAATAAAHKGHLHNVLGTVKVLEEKHVVITKIDGKDMTVFLTKDTKYEKGKQRAKRTDLVKNARVSISLANDSRTAVTVKIGGAKVAGK